MKKFKNTLDAQSAIDDLVSSVESSIADELIELHSLEVDCESVDFLNRLQELVDSETNDISESEIEELIELLEFKSDVENYCSWRYGADMIEWGTEESYFKSYLTNIGDLPNGVPDYIVIDWEATVQNLLKDYHESDLDGTTYYIKNN